MLAATAFVCNVDADGYVALGVIMRNGRLWTIVNDIDKGGIEDKAHQVLVAAILAEIEGLDRKVIFKIGA